MRAPFILAAGALALSASLAFAQETTLTDQHLSAADGDADGAVSESEFRATMQRVFAALDADKNGVVTWVEAEPAMLREHFDALDANKDGQVTATEMDAQASKDFATADQDGDGALN